ncbi:vesicle-associated protein 1-3-like [Panicum miliaceum]|uniref:Vesicle-associated protein 1-3-like n=1 Tax=Panicum miliaceum TaxID=4540 RepID=A0A3L6QEU9_PANMI|nr:vesicle-associated protein 1-3-like [Panicum miliaceum]
MSNTLLRVCPSDLKMPFELKKQNSACLELVNKTDQCVAFKVTKLGEFVSVEDANPVHRVKTTNPRKYAVRPASGVVPPRGSFGISIVMQAPKEIPPDYHCKDKFLVQSIVVEEGMAPKDIVPDMFSKAPGKLVEEFKLRVIYVPANPPSPVPEEAEGEDSLDSDVDHEVEPPSTSNSTSGHGHASRSQTSHNEDVSLVSKSGDQESRYAEENKKIQKELELLRKTKPSPGGFSATFVLLIFSLSFLLGYLMLGSRA